MTEHDEQISGVLFNYSTQRRNKGAYQRWEHVARHGSGSMTYIFSVTQDQSNSWDSGTETSDWLWTAAEKLTALAAALKDILLFILLLPLRITIYIIKICVLLLFSILVFCVLCVLLSHALTFLQQESDRFAYWRQQQNPQTEHVSLWPFVCLFLFLTIVPREVHIYYIFLENRNRRRNRNRILYLPAPEQLWSKHHIFWFLPHSRQYRKIRNLKKEIQFFPPKTRIVNEFWYFCYHL